MMYIYCKRIHRKIDFQVKDSEPEATLQSNLTNKHNTNNTGILCNCMTISEMKYMFNEKLKRQL